MEKIEMLEEDRAKIINDFENLQEMMTKQEEDGQVYELSLLFFLTNLFCTGMTDFVYILYFHILQFCEIYSFRLMVVFLFHNWLHFIKLFQVTRNSKYFVIDMLLCKLCILYSKYFLVDM